MSTEVSSTYVARCRPFTRHQVRPPRGGWDERTVTSCIDTAGCSAHVTFWLLAVNAPSDALLAPAYAHASRAPRVQRSRLHLTIMLAQVLPDRPHPYLRPSALFAANAHLPYRTSHPPRVWRPRRYAATAPSPLRWAPRVRGRKRLGATPAGRRSPHGVVPGAMVVARGCNGQEDCAVRNSTLQATIAQASMPPRPQRTHPASAKLRARRGTAPGAFQALLGQNHAVTRRQRCSILAIPALSCGARRRVLQTHPT